MHQQCCQYHAGKWNRVYFPPTGCVEIPQSEARKFKLRGYLLRQQSALRDEDGVVYRKHRLLACKLDTAQFHM